MKGHTTGGPKTGSGCLIYGEGSKIKKSQLTQFEKWFTYNKIVSKPKIGTLGYPFAQSWDIPTFVTLRILYPLLAVQWLVIIRCFDPDPLLQIV
jgi:hypothetical protein